MARSRTVLCLIFLYVNCCIVRAKSCGDTRCQVLVEEGDSASQFRSKATEEGVRLVYLNFAISGEPFNCSYKPLISKNKILPYRWTWARSVSEVMLSLSYDYDVLSLGLMTNQVRGMAVPLMDSPSGCLKDLNTSCQDIAVARALLELTRDLNRKPLSDRKDVVCFRVLHEHSFGVGEDFKYECCAEDRQNNKSEVLCNQSVIESEWLAIFNAILVVVVGGVFLYWPLLLCPSPDVVHEGEFDSKRIPVDDFSPVTSRAIVQTFAKKLTALSHSINIKCFFLWYCVVPLFFYIKVILYLIIKGSPLDSASRKLLFQAFNSYFYVFDFDRPLVYVAFIFPLFIIPGAIISCWRPGKSTTKGRCRFCNKKGLIPEMEILEHLRVMPQKINCRSKLFLNSCTSIFFRNNRIHSHHSLCGHVICVLWSVALVSILWPIFAMIVILTYVFVSVAYIIAFSPCFCLATIAFRLIRELFSIGLVRFTLLAVLGYSAVSVFLVLAFSSQFAVRMFGFVIMGITLNAEFAVPYITFVFVVSRNVYLCYRNLQNKYKQVKEMISEEWKEVTIPIDLFWKVCNYYQVLPLTYEVFVMLRNIVFILVFLIVALTGILLFKVVYNSSAIISSVAVFLSGKFSEMFFTGVTTGFTFSGWQKICKEKMIARAVEEYREETTEKCQRGRDFADSPSVLHEAAV